MKGPHDSEKKRPAPLLTHDLLALKYLGVWSCDKSFMVWVSEDESALQVTGPEGEVIVLIELRSRPHIPVWCYPEKTSRQDSSLLN